MQFNSYSFIFLFLPVILTAYFGACKFNTLLGKLVIIAGSIFFYTGKDLTSFKVLGISLVINYLLLKFLEKHRGPKMYMLFPVIVNVGMLLYYKYTNFLLTNIAIVFGKEIGLKELFLPIGISFFTFQQIAFIVAVYREEIKTVRFVDYASYILYFPKLLMGPLMDPVDFLEQWNDSALKRISWDNMAAGLKLFSFGLFKKLVLADTFAKAVAWGFSNTDAATSMDWILVTLFYTFEIYFDFSGYSDMAVGISQMLNISLPINFDSPYKAVSVRDFWKRWHISLTKFLTKYIYFPLGGSRKGLFFTCLNTMIVFLISGIWHGANWTFIVWGLLHGAFSIMDRLIEKIPGKIFEPARWLMTFVVLNGLWLLFRADSLAQWRYILIRILSLNNLNISDGLLSSFALPEAAVLFRSVPLISVISKKMRGFIMNVFIAGAAAICFFPENNYRKKD
ncbi:MAG: MBOAT family protein, partial [Firmicutes bacterium]|nr:MBOAT family protein [Bacillota bacterium]